MPESEQADSGKQKRGILGGGLFKMLLMAFGAFIASTALMYLLTMRLQQGVPPLLSRTPVVGDMLRRAFPQAVSLAPRIWQRDDTQQFLQAAVALEMERLRLAREAFAGLRQSIAAEGDRLLMARTAFGSVRQDVEDLLAVPGSEREANIKRLATLYSAIRPEEAAPILSAMDTAMVIDVIKRMDERAAGKLLAAMSPSLAAELSAEIGGTHVRALAKEAE